MSTTSIEGFSLDLDIAILHLDRMIVRRLGRRRLGEGQHFVPMLIYIRGILVEIRRMIGDGWRFVSGGERGGGGGDCGRGGGQGQDWTQGRGGGQGQWRYESQDISYIEIFL